MKRLVTLISALLIIGCSATQVKPTATVSMDCMHPAGYEYICYDNDECNDYIRGYAGIIYERFRSKMYDKEDGKEKTTVAINLFYDHLGMSMIGTLSGEIQGNRILLTLDVVMYDIECKVLHKQKRSEYVPWRSQPY